MVTLSGVGHEYLPVGKFLDPISTPVMVVTPGFRRSDMPTGMSRTSFQNTVAQFTAENNQKQNRAHGSVLFLVTLIEANWNLICEEILRWVELFKGVQWSLPIPVQLGT